MSAPNGRYVSNCCHHDPSIHHPLSTHPPIHPHPLPPPLLFFSRLGSRFPTNLGYPLSILAAGA